MSIRRGIAPRTTRTRAGGPRRRVAPAVVYLASRDAGWTAGQTLSINGGRIT
jgi:NAD(P)-dependent dehydrogenase (short-subunit alcohol dehydrogenase family)